MGQVGLHPLPVTRQGKVKAAFRISERQLAEIRGELEMTDKAEPTFTVEVTDDGGEVVAQVEKVVQVRRKNL